MVLQRVLSASRSRATTLRAAVAPTGPPRGRTPSPSTANAGRRNDRRVPPTAAFARRGAHAQLSFGREDRRAEFTSEDLDHRIRRIRGLAAEARRCIGDARESRNTPEFDEELSSAAGAVGRAELAYSELLEELASRDRVSLLNEVRRMRASEGVWAELRGALVELRRADEGGMQQ